MQVITGSYTQHVGGDLEGTGNGMAFFEFNEETGQLKFKKEHHSTNVGYLAINKDACLIYTFQELLLDLEPKLLCYRLEGDSVELVSEIPIAGGLPCHILWLNDAKQVVVSCYQTGNVLIYALDDFGVPTECVQQIQFVGSSINAERQEASHAHMTFYIEHQNVLAVSDLGSDKIYFLAQNEKQLWEQVCELELPKGGGPRHLCMHPNGNYLFVINEMTAELSLVKYQDNKWEWLKNEKLLNAPQDGCASASAIKISPCGKHIYCGVRSVNAIAMMTFDIETDELSLLGHTETKGQTPRDFELSKDGKWLLVGNQDSSSISVFERDVKSGLLTYKYQNAEVESVCCIKFCE
ncbi:lactonase family protein [Labilibacter marinus]|uniref:lactonase family protein n=1 Tax=Labilibacter marinus TaxID=1477105 RepID=UPI00082A9C8B|nr:beta-propeller fold lactonase family protein [Labilibacter marinus]